MIRLGLVLVGGLLTQTPSVIAQGSKADYDRAQSIRQLAQNKVFRDVVKLNWLPDGNRAWYRVQTGPQAHEFVLVDAISGTRLPAFDHERLAASLNQAGLKDIRATRLLVSHLEFAADGKALTISAGGKGWVLQLGDYSIREAPVRPAAPARPLADMPKASRRTGEDTSITFINRTSAPVELWWITAEGGRQNYGPLKPGERREQHTFDGHVWLVTDAAGKPLAWTQGEAGAREFEVDGTSPKAERASGGRRNRSANPAAGGRWSASIKDYNVWLRDNQSREEFALTTDGTAGDAYQNRFYWSPDSTRLVVMQEKPAQEHEVHFVESSPKDQLQPKLHTFNYLKPGDRIAHPRPRLFDVAARKPIPVSENLFPTPWNLTQWHWLPGGKEFAFLYNQRGHQLLRLLAVDAATGKVRTIVDERSETFIDYSQKTSLHWLDETGELIWMSERDGWNHLWLYDFKAGQVKNQITRGPWVVRKVERVDEQARQVWFWAGGVSPEQDPYYLHVCRVNFDGTGFIALTAGDGNHTVEFSPDRRFFVDTWSRVDQPPVNELRRSEDGSLVCELERGDARALLKTGWTAPERFVAKGRDGQTDIFGIIIKPIHFDATKKYPVIEEIYAGPHGSFVPKSWGLQTRAQALAELGFIVVRIDGMGTNWRSRQFHDVAWKNLKDAGFPDRIAWLKAAAVSRPWMNLTRVGIYGGSAGGQNTLAGLLHHGDFYRAGVADCGCHDNRMDKIWWNEAWLGWPVDDSYADNSNVTHAGKLQGKLMLVVGELDRNVDPASTMQVVDALVKADKDFELLIMPGTGHGAAETPYASRRRMDFFVRHLLGREPRWEQN